ncbi:MAG: lamin tail domain-containing protein [Ignavibacteriales bacterium]|nr:lamin tail domain-containing protein [Ignavibacteriales bacterium]
MYAPESPEPEWIEIFNKSNKNILFDKYKVADKTDTVEIISQPRVLIPNEYLIIADDSLITEVYPKLQNVIIAKLPTLNNSDDEISIMDSLFRVIDSLAYNSSGVVKWKIAGKN